MKKLNKGIDYLDIMIQEARLCYIPIDAITLEEIAKEMEQWPRDIDDSYILSEIETFIFIKMNTHDYFEDTLAKIKSEIREFEETFEGTIDRETYNNLNIAYGYLTYAARIFRSYADKLIRQKNTTRAPMYCILLSYAYECRELIGRLIRKPKYITMKK